MPKTPENHHTTGKARAGLKAIGAGAALLFLGACAEFAAGPELAALPHRARVPVRRDAAKVGQAHEVAEDVPAGRAFASVGAGLA